MTTQPVEPENTGRLHSIGNPSIPQFEGLPVSGLAIKISGQVALNAQDLPVFSVDDRVRVIGEFKCIGVRHTVAKNGDIIREQILSAESVDTCPWDPEDPTDDGVVRARP